MIVTYADMLERSIADRPDDMTIAMHMCRGNFRSTWVAQGGYDPAVDAIFNRTSVDVYLMEYDTERAGGLEPLRLLPKGTKRVMPGFITTKTSDLESIDELKARFEQASEYVDMNQLGIAPQCGFASTEEGNEITVDDQRAKLELVVTLLPRRSGAVSTAEASCRRGRRPRGRAGYHRSREVPGAASQSLRSWIEVMLISCCIGYSR